MKWRRSSRCADKACVEVASDDRRIYIRTGDGVGVTVLCVTRAEWEAFRDGVKLGDFDAV